MQKIEEFGLVKKGHAIPGDGGLRIDRDGFVRLMELHGFTSDTFQEASERLSKYPKERIPWHGDSYDPLRYVPVYVFLMHRYQKTGFQGKRILEIGPGGTGFMEELVNQGSEVYALDINPIPRKPGIIIETGRVEEITNHFSGVKFDVIVSSGVLHPGGGVEPVDEFQEAIWDYNIAQKSGRNTDEVLDKIKKAKFGLTHLFSDLAEKLEDKGMIVLLGQEMKFPKSSIENAGLKIHLGPKPFTETISLMAFQKK